MSESDSKKRDSSSSGTSDEAVSKKARWSSSDEKLRTRWTFDDPSSEMEWNEISSVKVDVCSSKCNALLNDLEADLFLLGLCANIDDTRNSGIRELDEKLLHGQLQAMMSENQKTFKDGAKMGASTPVLRTIVNGSCKKYSLLGLGSGYTKDIDTAAAYQLGSAVAAKCISEKGIVHCALALPFLGNSAFVEKFCSAFYTNLYVDNRYRSGDNVQKPTEHLLSLTLHCYDTDDLPNKDYLAKAVETGKIFAKGQILTKDIVNAPHNMINSLGMANVAQRIAAEYSNVMKIQILGAEECEKHGMGAYLGVARGSETPPQFIHLTYTPPSSSNATPTKLGIVGKGVMFDTGGYNIKTSMMELMKFDCGGGAAVLGAALVMAQLQPDGVQVHFIVPACENMINAKAYVPSDVLTASNGKTIEVINTDAEGRLTLADALVYADKHVGCESIIELSTLTGSAMVALGKKICGIFTQDDALAKQLEDASKTTADKSWRMPLPQEYNEELESIIADIKNCGSRYGGAITAGLFLQNFVGNKPFAHIDIAGPVWSDKNGATGFGVKLISEWILSHVNK